MSHLGYLLPQLLHKAAKQSGSPQLKNQFSLSFQINPHVPEAPAYPAMQALPHKNGEAGKPVRSSMIVSVYAAKA